MHLPHIDALPPNPRFERSRAAALHFTASKNASRGIPFSHSLPETAPPGQASPQAMQSPQRDLSIG